MDELVFEENPLDLKPEIEDQLKKLTTNYEAIQTYQGNIILQHRQIFEAIRQELIRIFTLGLTGFDTPGSINALPEAKVAMESLQEAIQYYSPRINQKDPDLSPKIDRKFTEAIQYLEQYTDFDTFDRLAFLKDYINPLYALTYQVHQVLGIEMIDEVNNFPQALNYHSVNIFGNDFFNIDYYARMDFSIPRMPKIIELGKTLFYDPILSQNNQGACATCHNPTKGFADGLPKSRSIAQDGHVQRNAPTVVNAAFAEKYFYDLREGSLERQMMHVVKDQKEFATDFVELIDKLEQSSEYKKLFREAYPQNGISTHSISNSIAAYVASLSSFNSPFDQYVRGEIKSIDQSVIRGFNLFMGKAACGTCHFAPNFNGTVPPQFVESESEVLGVPSTKDTLNASLDSDPGRAVNGVPRDEAPFYMFSFKTTTVRNIALTAPYMHNGVYDNLEEVLDFYNRGGGEGLGLGLAYQTLPGDPLNLNLQEQNDIISFMKALTDTVGITSLPERLPTFENTPEWNNRVIGGEY